MRQIITYVKSCENCYLRHVVKIEGKLRINCGWVGGRIIPEDDRKKTFPDWCPLEEVGDRD